MFLLITICLFGLAGISSIQRSWLWIRRRMFAAIILVMTTMTIIWIYSWQMYFIHCFYTLYRVQCNLCFVLSAMYFILCTDCNVLYTCFEWTVLYTLYRVKCTLYIVHSAMYFIHCTECNVMYTLFRVQCTSYIVLSAMYFIHFTECNVRYTLYRVQCTLYILLYWT